MLLRRCGGNRCIDVVWWEDDSWWLWLTGLVVVVDEVWFRWLFGGGWFGVRWWRDSWGIDRWSGWWSLCWCLRVEVPWFGWLISDIDIDVG